MLDFPGKKQETTASAKDVVVSDVRHFTMKFPDSQLSNCKKIPVESIEKFYTTIFMRLYFAV